MRNSVIENILTRRSIRAFKDEEVKKDDLETVIEAATYAPNGHNMQAWHFSVIQNKDIMTKLNVAAKENFKTSDNEFLRNLANNEKFNCFYSANTAILISVDKKAVTGQEDSILAAQNLMLAAHSIGLGTCWVQSSLMAFDGEKADEYKKLAQIPEENNVVACILIGHAAVVPPAPERKKDVISFVK